MQDATVCPRHSHSAQSGDGVASQPLEALLSSALAVNGLTIVQAYALPHPPLL